MEHHHASDKEPTALAMSKILNIVPIKRVSPLNLSLLLNAQTQAAVVLPVPAEFASKLQRLHCMAHVPETGAINRLRFFAVGAGFW